MFKHSYYASALCFIFFSINESTCLNFNGELNKIKFMDETGNIHYIDLAAPVKKLHSLNLTHRFSSENVQFWLYIRENVNDYEEIFISEGHVMSGEKRNSSFKPDKALVIVTHGWMNSGGSESTQMIKNAILAKYDVNVIVVNWKKESTNIDYVESATSTVLVANEIRKMILSLANQYKIKGKDIHLIGHSLGAHVMGSTGKMLKRKDNFIIRRVTGLDPARPFFEFPKTISGITSEAAAFVDIIHTNVGVLGYISNTGHADFYPNGGLWQPYCCGIKKTGICAHNCAYVYFAQSVSNALYISFKCDSYKSYLLGLCDDNETQLMGLPAMPTAKGSYYLNISSKLSSLLRIIFKKLF